MQVSLETTNGLERRLIIGVPSERIEGEVATRLDKAAKTIRLDGFRKGKVPMKVVKQRFGEGVRQEVVRDVINQTFFEALNQEKINPAGQPSIEPTTNEAGKDLEYVATFEVYPEITLSDLSQISVTKQVAELTEADVDKMIDILRQQQATWSDVVRPAKKGDQVTIDYLGRKDGVEFDGGKAENSKLELGSGQMIQGFEESIEGMEPGGEKTAALRFPDDYHAEELKGADVEFTIKLKKVAEKILPELDGAFFKKFGVEDGDEEKFRTEVAGNMRRELKNATTNKLKNRVITELLNTHEFPLPGALLQSEISNLKRQMLSQFGGNMKLDESALPDELFTKQAERRVKSGLIFSEIVKTQEIKPDAAKIREKIDEIASTYEEPEQVVQYYYSNDQLLKSVESLVAEDQIIEYLERTMRISEESVPYEEAVKPDREEVIEE